MRILLIALLGLASCSTTADQARFDANNEAKLQQLLAGKVAGKAQRCLSMLRSHEMVRIDDDTLLYKDGSRRIYRSELNGDCHGLGSSGFALVTGAFGGSSGQLCSGDIARTVDLSSGLTAGSCVIGEFVPYTTMR